MAQRGTYFNRASDHSRWSHGGNGRTETASFSTISTIAAINAPGIDGGGRLHGYIYIPVLPPPSSTLVSGLLNGPVGNHDHQTAGKPLRAVRGRSEAPVAWTPAELWGEASKVSSGACSAKPVNAGYVCTLSEGT